MKRTTIFLAPLILASIISCQEYLMDDSSPSLETKSGEYTYYEASANGAEDGNDSISKDEALKAVEPIICKYSDRGLDISEGIIPAGTKIAYNMLGYRMKTDNLSYFTSPDFDAWLIVLGFDPTYLGRQQVLHLFVNAKTKEVHEQRLEGRAIVEWDTSRYTFIYDDHLPVVPERDLHSLSRSSSPTKWAVIISSGGSALTNYACFYEETKRLYNHLVDSLNYSKGNIICLMSDGNNPGLDQRAAVYTTINSDTDFDNDGYSDVYDAAVLSRVRDIFSDLLFCTIPGDEVLVCLIGQGDDEHGFYLWYDEFLSPRELNVQLNKLGQSVMVDVVLSQSYSDHFHWYISGTNISVATSCSETALAHYYSPGPSCPFMRRWTNSISIYDNANTNDGYVTSQELFSSARDSLSTISGCNDQPQFYSDPLSFGSNHSLRGEIIPVISGSNYLSTSRNVDFTIDNLPEYCSTTWGAGFNSTIVSYTDSSAAVRGYIPESSQYCSSSAPIHAWLTVAGKTHHISKLIDSVWKPGTYVDKNHVWGSNGTYRVRSLGGEYGYQWYSSNPAWQVINYNADMANVLEGYTDYPVSLIVNFYDPLGEMITVMEQVH